jgi:hypothetical protein
VVSVAGGGCRCCRLRACGLNCGALSVSTSHGSGETFGRGKSDGAPSANYHDYLISVTVGVANGVATKL